MKNLFFLFSFSLLFAFSACNTAEKHEYIQIETDFGIMKVKLFNSTPIHRDNILKLTKEGFYDDLLFHRVMNGFMIQGGDPDSKNAPISQRLGGGGLDYQLQAELGAPHIKGALAAARTPNPEKKSSSCQFYLVHGKKMKDAELDGLQKQKGITYSAEQRRLYKELGGAPFLDMDYTVYGEVVEGLDVIDKIAVVPTQPGDRPEEDIKMKVKYLGKE